MPDLLIRGLDEETHRALKRRAAKNSRSVQAEALAIITSAAAEESRPGGWVGRLADAFAGAEEEGFALPDRHPARTGEAW